MYSVDNRPVRRRFRDFVWLHNALSVEFPACVIPPLPEKHRISKIMVWFICVYLFIYLFLAA